MIIHVFAGFLETFRFAYLDLYEDPRADVVDLVLCLLQSVTNGILVSRMKRGIKVFTRE